MAAWPEISRGGGGIFEKFSARGVYQKYPPPPLFPLPGISLLEIMFDKMNYPNTFGIRQYISLWDDHEITLLILMNVWVI